MPAFYLYNFTNDQQRHVAKDMPHRKTNIYHYDFRGKCVRERPIENVAVESYFLSHKKPDGSYDHSLDNEVQAVEGRAAKAINELQNIRRFALTARPRAVEIANNVIDDLMELIFWQIKRHPAILEDLQKDCEQYLIENSRSPQEAKQMALRVIKEVGKDRPYNIKDELNKKNKIIICTSTNDAHFITTDKPFVTFNKTGRNGFAVQDTEIYFPITSNMLLFMHNNGSTKKFTLESHRSELRKLNIYMAKSASRYLFGPSKTYLERIVKNIG